MIVLSIPCNNRYSRNGGALLWYFYKQLQCFADHLDQTVFVGFEKNYVSPALLPDDAWEKNPETLRRYNYRLPDEKTLRKARVIPVDPAIFRPLEEKLHSSNLVWKALMTGVWEPYADFLRRQFRLFRDEGLLDFVILMCNDPSAELVAKEFSVPVIHNELGPTRAPEYLPTAYWDLSGVNGHTEAEARFRAAPPMHDLSGQELFDLFASPAQKLLLKRKVSGRIFPCGVAGQVEDDSNILAYSNGFDNLELLKFASFRFGPENVLFRPHPAGQSVFSAAVDRSPNSGVFLKHVERLLTINSSTALEAALLGKPVTVFGDSPMRLLSSPLPPARASSTLRALNFLLLNYCIPFEYLFDFEYCQWRLSRPSEPEIRARHLAFYRKAQKAWPPASGVQSKKTEHPDPVILHVADVPRDAVDLKNYREAYLFSSREAADYKKSYESVRLDAENYKKSFESARSDAENYKKSFESVQADAVNYKKAFESAKTDAENYRKSYESVKTDAAGSRALYESANIELEKCRKDLAAACSEASDYRRSYESMQADAANYKESFESAKADAENYKKSFESMQADAENYRKSFESAKADAENYKKSFESLQADAENYRKLFESAQLDVENYRKSFESVKTDAENYKKSFESAKADAENYKKSFESAKSDAENYKKSFEAAKSDAENYKKSFESAKSDAENYKKSFEAAKSDAENYKKSFESAKADAENYKDSFESAKSDAENYRKSFESAKADAGNYKKSNQSLSDEREALRRQVKDLEDRLSASMKDAQVYREAYEYNRQDAENYRKAWEYNEAEAKHFRQKYEELLSRPWYRVLFGKKEK